MTRTQLVVCVLALLLAQGCGGRRDRADFAGDPRLERQAGAVAAAITRAELGQVELPELDAYLDRLVEHLASRLSAEDPEEALEWRVSVIDSPDVVSVGFPGGHLLLSRGLLVEVVDEAALLRVLAAEMAHVVRGHATSRLQVLVKLRAPGMPEDAEDLVLPGLGRPLSSVGVVASGLASTPYGEDERADIQPLLGQLLAGEAPEAGPEPFPRPLAGLAVGSDPRGGVLEGPRMLHRELDLSVSFPQGWPIQNAADFIGASQPGGQSRVILQLAGEGDDPVGPARAFAQGGGARFGLLPRGREIGGRPAARAFGYSGDAVLDVTWVLHGGLVYQITGVCPAEDYERLQVDFIDVALSLGPLGEDVDPGRFEPLTLHLERAQPGESVAGLVARTGSSWSAAEVARLAGVDADAPLAGEPWVRIPRRAPQPTPPSDPAPPPAGDTARAPRP